MKNIPINRDEKVLIRRLYYIAQSAILYIVDETDERKNTTKGEKKDDED